jgi:hypothetical protein
MNRVFQSLDFIMDRNIIKSKLNGGKFGYALKIKKCLFVIKIGIILIMKIIAISKKY